MREHMSSIPWMGLTCRTMSNNSHYFPDGSDAHFFFSILVCLVPEFSGADH